MKSKQEIKDQLEELYALRGWYGEKGLEEDKQRENEVAINMLEWVLNTKGENKQ